MSIQFKQILLIGLIATTVASCSKRPGPDPIDPTPVTEGEMGFTFNNYVGDKPLTLGTETYTNCASEDFTVTKFNYYITNVKLIATDGSEYAQPESYHLVKQDVAGSHHFHIMNVPAGQYKGVKFLIGVDEARNTSGAQDGALDPANEMYWSWNTGYIMAKLEGTSASAQDGKFTQHIGGFKGDFNSIRTVTLNFPNTLTINSTSTGEAEVKADVLKWFGGSTCVDLATASNIMNPSATSKKIADNYATMFSIISATTAVE